MPATALDRGLDSRVFDLYSLDAEEIAAVEASDERVSVVS
jgi:hypothetical protein